MGSGNDIISCKRDSVMKFSFLKSFIIFILLFALVEPEGIVPLSIYKGGLWLQIHQILKIMKYIAILGGVPMIFKIGKPSKMLLSIYIFNFLIFISCLYNNNLSDGYFNTLLKITLVSIVAEYYMVAQNPMDFIQVFFFFLLFSIIVNLCTIIVYPEGMYIDERGWGYNYYLGFKNLHIYFFLPCMLILSVLQYYKYKKIKIIAYLLLAVLVVSCILNHSTTSLIVVMVLSILFLFIGKIKLPKYYNLFVVFFMFLILSVILISKGILGDLVQYSEAIADKADKTGDSFASRILIWIDAIKAIKEHPIFGNGNFCVSLGENDYYQMHNQYIDIVTQGGIVLSIIFILQIILLSKEMRKLHGIWLYNIFLIIFTAYFVEFMAEARRNNYLWYVLLIICYHLPSIINSNNNLRKRVQSIKKISKDENNRSNTSPL